MDLPGVAGPGPEHRKKAKEKSENQEEQGDRQGEAVSVRKPAAVCQCPVIPLGVGRQNGDPDGNGNPVNGAGHWIVR